MQLFGAPIISNSTDLYSCQTIEERVDQTGHFKVMIWHSISGVGENGSRVSISRHVLFDGSDLEPWMWESKSTWQDSLTGEYHTSAKRWIAPDGSIRFSIYDGMYMLLPGDKEFASSTGRSCTPIIVHGTSGS